VAQVQIRGRGVKAAIDPQGDARAFARFQPLAQLFLHVFCGLLVAKIYTAHENGHLVVYGWEGRRGGHGWVPFLFGSGFRIAGNKKTRAVRHAFRTKGWTGRPI
jgi:hypothetical protein